MCNCYTFAYFLIVKSLFNILPAYIKKQAFFFKELESSSLFIHCRYKSLDKYVYYKLFISVCGLPIHFIIGSPNEQKYLILIKSSLLVFPELFINSTAQEVFVFSRSRGQSFLSTRCFIVTAFMFRFMIHLRLILICSMRQGSRLLLPYGYQQCQRH